MGGSLSSEQKAHAKELHQLVKRLITDRQLSLGEIEALLLEIACRCPWYPEKGRLSTDQWKLIGNHLKAEPRPSLPHLVAWQTVNTAVVRLNESRPTAPPISLLEQPQAISNFPVVALPLPQLQKPATATSGGTDPARAWPARMGAVAAGIAEARQQGVNLWEGDTQWEPDSHPALFPVTFERAAEPNSTNAPLPIAPSQESVFAVKAAFQDKQQKGTLTGIELAEGFQASPVTQTELPPKVLAISSDCAFLTFQKMPSSDQPEEGFATNQQGPVDFVNQLQAALAQQDDIPEAATELFIKMAKDNKDCQQALEPLMASRNFTLADMLKVCQDMEMSVAQLVLLPFAVPNPADIEPDGIDVQWIEQTVTIQ